MRLSKRQIAALHMAAKQAGITDAQRRTVMRTLAGVDTCTSPAWGRYDYQRVMAQLEDLAGGDLDGYTPHYWRRQADGGAPLDAMLHRVRQVARRLGWSDGDLDRFVASGHCTSGMYRTLEDLPVYWLARCLEALQAMLRRQTTQSQ